MLDEPTRDEIIRDIQGNVQALLDSQDRYILKAQYEADQALAAVHREADRKRLTDLEEKDKTRVRMLVSALVLPLLVILLAYAMGVRP